MRSLRFLMITYTYRLVVDLRFLFFAVPFLLYFEVKFEFQVHKTLQKLHICPQSENRETYFVKYVSHKYFSLVEELFARKYKLS